MAPESPLRAESDHRILAQAAAAQASLFDEPSSQEQLLDDYRQRYGLAEDPFADDFSFPLFTASGRREILDQLLHLSQFSQGVLVLLGEPGTGKTRMAHAFLDSLAEQDLISLLSLKPGQQAEAIAATLVEDFDLGDARAPLGELQQILAAFASEPATDDDGLAFVVVDDAHLLTAAATSWLLTFAASLAPGSRLHFLLCGEPQLMGQLEARGPDSLALNDFYLQPLTLTEAVDYLNFRMEMADYLGPEIFTESMVAPWWRQAQGQLPLLHEAAQQQLLSSVVRADAKPRSPLPIMHIIAISLVVAVVGVFFLYLDDSDKPQSTAPTSVTLPAPSALPQAQPAENTQDVKPLLPSLGGTAQPSVSTQNVANTAEQSGTTANSTALNTAANLDELVRKLPETQPAELSEPAAHTNETQVVTAKDKVAQSQPDTAIALNTKTRQAKPAIAAAQTGVYSDQELKILGWSAGNYTIQLLGVTSRTAALDYLAQQPNRAQLLLFKSKRQGKDWFVVITGNFASIAQARAAIESLSSAQRKAGPWPRQVGPIQQEIKAAH